MSTWQLKSYKERAGWSRRKGGFYLTHDGRFLAAKKNVGKGTSWEVTDLVTGKSAEEGTFKACRERAYALSREIRCDRPPEEFAVGDTVYTHPAERLTGSATGEKARIKEMDGLSCWFTYLSGKLKGMDDYNEVRWLYK